MVFTHIAFPRACVNRRSTFALTIVKTGVSLGANSTVVPGITIGAGAFLAAGSTLTKDCKDWSLMLGTPARHIAWVSAYGEKIPLPLSGEGTWTCDNTGDVYALDGATLVRDPGPRDILNTRQVPSWNGQWPECRKASFRVHRVLYGSQCRSPTPSHLRRSLSSRDAARSFTTQTRGIL